MSVIYLDIICLFLYDSFLNLITMETMLFFIQHNCMFVCLKFVLFNAGISSKYLF